MKKRSISLIVLTFLLTQALLIVSVASAQTPPQTTAPAASTPGGSGAIRVPVPAPTVRIVSFPVQTFTAPPTLAARSAIAIDADTGRILYSKNANMRLPMASTTKIMTALTLFSIPGANLNDVTTVVEDDLVGEANMGLWTGQRLKVIDLLYGTLLDSANDGAMALARYGGNKLSGSGNPVDKFVAEMNKEAARLGLSDTNFTNPHGLDSPLHYSSAHDLAVAGWYALQNPTIAGIVKQDRVQFDGYSFVNISNFIRRYPGANGVKPGETDEAGLCLVASSSRFGHNAIAVLLNDPKLRTESDLLMDYAFSQILTFDELRAPQSVTTAPVTGKYLVPGYIGLPSSGKLEPYGAYVKDVQSELKKALFFMYCANLIFGSNKP